MKKLIASAASALAYGLPAAALAQLPNQGGFTELNGNVALGNKPLIQTIGSLINVILGFLGVGAVILVLWGGFKIMMSAGNEEQQATGKKAIAAGVIGLLIVLSAFAIATYVVGSLSNATY